VTDDGQSGYVPSKEHMIAFDKVIDLLPDEMNTFDFVCLIQGLFRSYGVALPQMAIITGNLMVSKGESTVEHVRTLSGMLGNTEIDVVAMEAWLDEKDGLDFNDSDIVFSDPKLASLFNNNTKH